MRALILAAGMGTRLKELTSSHPKCLTIVQGETILERQISSFLQSGITEIYVVIGYMAEEILKRYSERWSNVTFIINEEYATTNNMYSCFLARKYLDGHEFFLINGDVFLDPEILFRVGDQRDVLCLDSQYYKEDSMKVILKDGQIRKISKTISEKDSKGSSIDLYCFSSKSSIIYFSYIANYLQENVTHWNEIALNQLFSQQILNFQGFDIYPLRWEEIDNLEDLERAWLKFSEPLGESDFYYIDIDGTTLLNQEFIPGVSDYLNFLSGKVTFITNNTSKSPEEYSRLLKREIRIPFEILTPLHQIIETYQGEECYFFLNENVKEYLLQNGLKESSSPQIIIVGHHTSYTYNDLCELCLKIQSGKNYVLTHPDPTCPYGLSGERIPDIGALKSLIVLTTGVEPIRIFGKSTLTVEPGIVIGDRPSTDGELSIRNNCKFGLVLTGSTKIKDLKEKCIIKYLKKENI